MGSAVDAERPSSWLPFAAGVVVVLVLGVLALATPFAGDQALFSVAASGIADGDVYYRDIWDLKQPGIFYFYAAGGALFGYSEVGIHLAELLLYLVMTVLIGRGLRRVGADDVLSVGVPVTLFGMYYLTVRPVDMTQLEIQIAAFGLLALVVLCGGLARSSGGPGRAAVVTLGVAVALVGWYKLLLAVPVVGAAAGATVVLRGRRWAFGRAGVLALWLPAGAVAAALTLAWFAWFGWRAGWDEVARSTFIDPGRISRLPGLHTKELAVDLAKRSVTRFGPLVPLVLVAVFRRARPLPIEALRVASMVWVPLAAAVVAGQRWSAYQVEAVAAPLAVLAVLGAREVVAGLRSTRRGPWLAVVALCLVGALLPAENLAQRMVDLGSSDLALTEDGRFEFRVRQLEGYGMVRRQIDEGGLGPGTEPIYVLGDPLFHHLSGRPIAIAVNGWLPEYYLPRHWDRVTAELAAALPCDLFIDRFSQSMIDDRGATLQAFLDDAYQARQTVEGTEPGTWYIAEACG